MSDSALAMKLGRIAATTLGIIVAAVAGLCCAQSTAGSATQIVDVRSYVPSAMANSGYTGYLRIINSSTTATPVFVAAINATTGEIGPSGQLTTSLPAAAAVTFSAQQVEAALGVSLAADDRPRVRVTTTAPVEVQSFLSNPTGVVTQSGDAATGALTHSVPSYIPGAMAGSGYCSYIRVINVGTAATALQVTVIDGDSGVAGASGQLTTSLRAGGAATFTAQQVEAALGVALPAASRPRILLTGSVPLEVQSFQANPGGVVTQNGGSRAGKSVSVQSYIPAALSFSGYTSFIRVINIGAQPTPIGVSLIDAATGRTSASGQLAAAMPPNAAVTFSSGQIEAALGVVLAAQDRPRILVTSPSNDLSVQSFQSNPGGVVTQNLETRGGTYIDTRSYIPAAMAARGYMGYLRVINPGGTATPVSVTLIDGMTGMVGASGTLTESLPAGGAITFSAQQIETALGEALPADFRPRIRVTTTAPVEVQSFQSSPSGVVTHNGGAQYPLTSLPVLRIKTNDAAAIVSKDTYIGATFLLTDQAASSQPIALNGQIRGRGHSTWGQPKNPYKIQFTNDAKYGSVPNFLGMRKNRNWALLADFFDRTLIRNKLALSLGASSVFADGLKWTPAGQHVEAYLNDDYIGVYLLTEDVRIDPARLNLKKMDPNPAANNVDGGYIVEVDHYLDCYNVGDLNLQHHTPRGVPICIHKPDEADITLGQLAYIKNLLNSVEDELFGPNTLSKINPASFADWYLLSELFRNNDSAFWASAYMWKDTDTAANPADRLLNMGPLWDFDISAGNYSESEAWKTEGCWISKTVTPWPNWFTKLFDNADFVDLTISRWKQKRPALETFINSSIDAFASQLQGAEQRNFARWPHLGLPLVSHYTFSTYAEEVAFLKQYLNQRMAWLDQAYASTEAFNAMCK